MEQEKPSNPSKYSEKTKNILLILASVSITIVLIGLLSYLYYSNRDQEKQEKIDMITAENKRLNNDLLKLVNEVENLKESMKDEDDQDDDVKDEIETDKSVVEEDQIESSEIREFSYDDKSGTYYGEFTATGYITTKEVGEFWCESDCDTYTYASFNISSTDNEDIYNFIEEYEGNSFVGANSIGLGCILDNELSRANSCDDCGTYSYSNDATETASLLNATENNPVKVRINRYLFTQGMGAPSCYSHFAEVEVVE